jgi:hypothetical protein
VHGHAPPGSASANRDMLFGGRTSTSELGSASCAVDRSADSELLETRNGRSVDVLRDRVGDMRHLALDIGTEVDEQNKLLDGMGRTFDGASDRLGETMRALQRLTANQGGGHLCILFTFTGLFFFLVYLLLK